MKKWSYGTSRSTQEWKWPWCIEIHTQLTLQTTNVTKAHLAWPKCKSYRFTFMARYGFVKVKAMHISLLFFSLSLSLVFLPSKSWGVLSYESSEWLWDTSSSSSSWLSALAFNAAVGSPPKGAPAILSKKTKVDLQITDPGIPWLHQFRHGALARRRHRNLSCCGFLVFPALPINSHMVHFRNLNWRYLTWVSHSKPKAWASPTKNLPNVRWKVGHPCFFCGSFRRRAQRRPRSRSVAGYATHHHDFICGQRMRTVEHEKMELYKN